MKSKSANFDALLQSVGNRYDMRQVFEDFLTVCLCAFSQNPNTGMSYDEGLYLETIRKYSEDFSRQLFPDLLSTLLLEMEEGLDIGKGTDVLGAFYETHLAKRGRSQYFTPWPICMMMAQMQGKPQESESPIRVLDSSCGSGRMLLAAAKHLGPAQKYYGVDIDLSCVKMAILNLFLNGIFHAEILCANALRPGDFQVSYRTSSFPFGIFRIDRAEDSLLWNMLQAGTAQPLHQLLEQLI